jgi:ribosomal protein L44E
MPKAWTKKDERQYEHIKDSAKSQGKPLVVAKEIAARTVNKQRRLDGRTSSRETQGTGNPHKPLEDRTKKELENRAAQLEIRGRTRMTKAELVEAIKAA